MKVLQTREILTCSTLKSHVRQARNVTANFE